MIHTRAADDDTIATLARDAEGLAVILHCFSMPDRLEECLEHGWWISFAGNVTYPKARELAAAAERVPLDRLLVETDAPYLTPQAVRKERNQPAYVVHTARFIAERRGIDYDGARGRRRANSAAAVRLVSELPAQPSLRRLREFGVRPNRDLGQNFLIDSNILGVIERAAELGPTTSCSRSAAGSACCPSTSRERVAHVHVVEIDRALEPALRDALDPHSNATLHLADAMQARPRARSTRRPTRSSPTCPTASRRPSSCARSRSCPRVDDAGWRWCSGRWGSGSPPRPARRAYGVPSVLAQLACEVRVLRPVSRTVFHPVPNVDSVLVGLRRRGPAPEPALRALRPRGFAHRRKALPRSLALAPGAAPAIRDRARAALEAIGRPADARAERLSPGGVARAARGAGAA